MPAVSLLDPLQLFAGRSRKVASFLNERGGLKIHANPRP